jgi:hypothetical protein
MTIRTVPIASGLTALLRSEFSELLDAAGQHRHDKDGQPLYSADIFVSGGLKSPFARAGEAGPAEIRLRTVGRPTVSNGVVRLDGDVRLSTWSQRQRGVVRTDAVLTAERVTNASDRPQMRGPLAVAWNREIPVCFLDFQPSQRPGEPGLATVGIAPVAGSPWQVDGLGEIHVTTPPSVDLFPGVEVELHDLVAGFYVPDEGGRDAARLVLGCSRIEARNAPSGRKPKHEQAPEPVAVEG